MSFFCKLATKFYSIDFELYSFQAEEHAEILSKDLEKTQSLLSDIEEEKKRLDVEATQVSAHYKYLTNLRKILRKAASCLETRVLELGAAWAVAPCPRTWGEGGHRVIYKGGRG